MIKHHNDVILWCNIFAISAVAAIYPYGLIVFFLAPTGALIGIECYYKSAATFWDFKHFCRYKWCSMMFYNVLWCSMWLFYVLWCSFMFYDDLWCSMMFFVLRAFLVSFLSERTSGVSPVILTPRIRDSYWSSSSSSCSVTEKPG